MKVSKTQQIRELEREVRELRRAKQTLLLKIEEERLLRISAQRGLVPYVRAVEEFNRRVKTYPESWPSYAALNQQLEADLRELGLWGVKLGYDPDKDLNLSVASAKRYADLHDALRVLTEDPHVKHGHPL